MSDFVNDFEQRFESSLPKDLCSSVLLLGVSGGSDSMAMLSCAISLITNPIFNDKYKNLKLKVVTVNHRLRTEKESLGDCLFVQKFCDSKQIPCCISNADENQISFLAKKRNMGLEEAARFFRYDIFEKIALHENSNFFFLAHNKDDQVETLIQRFFQGAYGTSALGIPENREIFYRPMMKFTKEEILKYLDKKNIEFKTDKTNYQNDYLRNKIRNLLIPQLSEIFVGWKTALLNGVEKRKIDEDFFESECNKYQWNYSENEFFMDKSIFEKLHKSIKIRLVYQCLTKLKANHRIPFEIIESFCEGNNNFSGGINFLYTNDKVLINNKKNSSTESYFFAIMEESSGIPIKLSTPKGNLCFSDKPFNIKNMVDLPEKIKIPCYIELKNGKFVFEEVPSRNQKTVFIILED